MTDLNGWKKLYLQVRDEWELIAGQPRVAQSEAAEVCQALGAVSSAKDAGKWLQVEMQRVRGLRHALYDNEAKAKGSREGYKRLADQVTALEWARIDLQGAVWSAQRTVNAAHRLGLGENLGIGQTDIEIRWLLSPPMPMQLRLL